MVLDFELTYVEVNDVVRRPRTIANYMKMLLANKFELLGFVLPKNRELLRLVPSKYHLISYFQCTQLS
jgi:hypothetical protein